MQKKIGNDILENEKYQIIYSKAKNLSIIIKVFLISFLILIGIALVLLIFKGITFFCRTYKIFVFLYLVVFMFGLVGLLPNYFRDSRYCKNYQIQIDERNFEVKDLDMNRTIKFSFDDIQKYKVIFFGYTIYEAIQLDVKDGKRIIIYKSMENYERLKSQLLNSSIEGTNYIFKPIGHLIKNIF